MKVSTRGDYACRALLSLALHGLERPTSVKEIAERTDLPQPYLEQILLAAKGAGLVRSKRGVGGGDLLARPPTETTLAQILGAVEVGAAVGWDVPASGEQGAAQDRQPETEALPTAAGARRPPEPVEGPGPLLARHARARIADLELDALPHRVGVDRDDRLAGR